MAEQEAMREREAESKPRALYDELFRLINTAQQRSETGKIVIRGKDLPWEKSRQGLLNELFKPPAIHTEKPGGFK